MHKIDLEHISHYYGNNEVLKDFSFSFAQGKTTCLFGPSGCGKTTVMRLIAGLEKPSGGLVKINGEKVSENGVILLPAHLREIGFVFQDLALWPHFSVYDNIAFGLREKREKNIKEKVSEALDLFGITNKYYKYPHQLSGGQKQMVAIARSLALQPKILLMDEPLANIDTKLKENILEHLKSLQKQKGFTMLYVTHDPREVLNIGDFIITMKTGKIEAWGSKEEISNLSAEFSKPFLKT